MLPICREDEYLYNIPKFDLDKNDIDDFMNELKGFHEQFYDCFHRSESRDHFYKYMAGQFSDIEKKSIEPIALAMEDGNVRAMQRFVSESVWDDNKIEAKYQEMVAEDLGTPDGVLIFDESGFPKKGKESIGVSSQYCGNIGKVDNCQVGVFASYASEYGYCLVDKRLFIPEKWFDEDYSERRQKCKLPDEYFFQTKPQLASEMLTKIVDEKRLPFKYITADSVYGMSPEFVGTVESLPDIVFLLSISKDTPCWLRKPMITTKHYRRDGVDKTKTTLSDSDNKPLKVEKLAKSINDFFWYRRKVSEGTKGPIVYEFTRRRVWLSSNGLPGNARWLLIRRTLGDDPEFAYFVSNTSANASFSTLIWLSGIRWAIEQCFEETKSELGMDHYEVRKFQGWHHHILTCMLAHFFLWHLKIRLGKKSKIYYAVAA